jgi:hypothetical protein
MNRYFAALQNWIWLGLMRVIRNCSRYALTLLVVALSWIMANRVQVSTLDHSNWSTCTFDILVIIKCCCAVKCYVWQGNFHLFAQPRPCTLIFLPTDHSYSYNCGWIPCNLHSFRGLGIGSGVTVCLSTRCTIARLNWLRTLARDTSLPLLEF